jgi:hypothetical protein
MDWPMSLFVLCSAAGLVMVTGSLFLLWKGRIDLHLKGREAPDDAVDKTDVKEAGKQGKRRRHASNDMSELTLPLGFKIGTQFPVLIMFFFGVFMLVYPVYYAKNICPDLSLHRKIFPEMVNVKAKVKSPIPIDVYAVVAYQDKARNDVILNVPLSKGTYRLIYSYNSAFTFLDPFELKDASPLELRPIEVQASPASTPDIANETRADQTKVIDFK